MSYRYNLKVFAFCFFLLISFLLTSSMANSSSSRSIGNDCPDTFCQYLPLIQTPLNPAPVLNLVNFSSDPSSGEIRIWGELEWLMENSSQSTVYRIIRTIPLTQQLSSNEEFEAIGNSFIDTTPIQLPFYPQTIIIEYRIQAISNPPSLWSNTVIVEIDNSTPP